MYDLACDLEELEYKTECLAEIVYAVIYVIEKVGTTGYESNTGAYIQSELQSVSGKLQLLKDRIRDVADPA